MSAKTNILLKDDTVTTPVEFTFIPSSAATNLWRTQTAGVPLNGQHSLEIVANDLLKSGAYRRVFKATLRVMETLGASGASSGYVAPPKVAYEIPVTISCTVDPRATVADVANAVKFAAGALAGGSSTTATGTLDGASAGDAWKNGTGPITRFVVYGEEPF
jgi:hypothetical protein